MKITVCLNPVFLSLIVCMHSFATEDSIDSSPLDGTDIQSVMDKMSLRQKIAQRMMFDFRYWSEDDTAQHLPVKKINEHLVHIVHDYHIGGIILFSENIRSFDQVTQLNQDFQAAVNDINPFGLFIGIDQEGGNVTRLPYQESVYFPGNMALCAACLGDENSELPYQMGKITGLELLSLGFNVNFSPVVDVQDNPLNPVINIRAFSESASIVSHFGIGIISGFQDAGIMSTLKHFPGHGNTATDSHSKLPIVSRTYEEAYKIDLLPYQNAIASDTPPDMIMTAHIQYPALDNSLILRSNTTSDWITTPATLSRTIQQDILRGQLGFDGLTISDALDMKAISHHFSTYDALKHTFNAGVDIALMPLSIKQPSDIDKLATILAQLEQAYKNNELAEDDLNESVRRILTAKKKRQIKRQSPTDCHQQTATKDKDVWSKIAKDIIRRSTTLIKNNGLLPISPENLGNTMVIAPLFKQAETMTEHLSSFYNVYPVLPLEFKSLQQQDWQTIKSMIDEYDSIIISTSNSSPTNITQHNDPEKLIADNHNNLSEMQWGRLIAEQAKKLKKNIIVVSMRMPYDIMHFDDIADAILASYNYCGFNKDDNHQNVLKQVIDTLVGTPPSGKLPVSIGCANNSNIDQKFLYKLGHGLSY